MKATVVKTYNSRWAMQRGVTKMTRRGYVIQQQSGSFTTNPFTFRWNKRKVVVTFALAQLVDQPGPDRRPVVS